MVYGRVVFRYTHTQDMSGRNSLRELAEAAKKGPLSYVNFKKAGYHLFLATTY